MMDDRKTLSERGVRVSMIARRFTKSNLATRDVALRLAKALIEAEFGVEEVALQQPLEITESEDEWAIVGGRQAQLSVGEAFQASDAHVEMVIAKIDCQVLDFKRSRTMPTSDWPGKPDGVTDPNTSSPEAPAKTILHEKKDD